MGSTQREVDELRLPSSTSRGERLIIKNSDWWEMPNNRLSLLSSERQRVTTTTSPRYKDRPSSHQRFPHPPPSSLDEQVPPFLQRKRTTSRVCLFIAFPVVWLVTDHALIQSHSLESVTLSLLTPSSP